MPLRHKIGTKGHAAKAIAREGRPKIENFQIEFETTAMRTFDAASDVEHGTGLKIFWNGLVQKLSAIVRDPFYVRSCCIYFCDFF